jgi:ABC-type uncharacterized transport system ATPase component
VITGITVTQQMSKARIILKNQVIPREKQFQQDKMGATKPGLNSSIKLMPNLIIIAGCNGAGKSTFASIISPRWIGFI